MKLENSVFEDTYRTVFMQTGLHDGLTNRSFLSFMENMAGAHSAYCHRSFSDLSKENKTWVILNWKLSVFSRPGDDALVTIKTWGRFFNKAYTIRDFEMYDAAGNLCAIASSKWCLVDFGTGKLSKIPENLDAMYHGFRDKSVFEMADFPKLKEPTTPILHTDDYKIRRFDLDINQHVHNLNYLNYAYEVLPQEVFDGPEFSNVEISYKKEVKYGDTIHSFLYKEGDAYIVVIKSQDEKNTHAIVKLYN